MPTDCGPFSGTTFVLQGVLLWRRVKKWTSNRNKKISQTSKEHSASVKQFKRGAKRLLAEPTLFSSVFSGVGRLSGVQVLNEKPNVTYLAAL